MNFWSFLSFLLFASPPMLPGQGVTALEAKGRDALANGVWELAELHFRECLADNSLTSEDQSRLALQLVESLIRAGKSSEALEILNLSQVADHPERRFWEAQALAGSGRLAEAVEIFALHLASPAAAHRAESAFTLASILRSLDKPEDAIQALQDLQEGSQPETAAKAKLLQVKILLELDRPVEARAAMPAAELLAARDGPLAGYLGANLLANEGETARAQAAFQALLNQPQGLSLDQYQAAVIGLADATEALGDPVGATKSLFTFIQNHPDSPALAAMFHRLQQWLPASLSSSDPILDQLAQWITPLEAPALGPIASDPDAEGSAAVSAWPTLADTDELLAHALFTRAIGVYRLGTPEARNEARQLMTRLRLENPGHPLANRSLHQLASWHLEEGRAEQALQLLETLRDSAKSPALRGEAAFLEGKATYTAGNLERAIGLFDEAARELTGPRSKSALFNAGIARIRTGDLEGVTLVQQEIAPTHPETAADLQLEMALAAADPETAKSALEEFLTLHPDHARASEARLAAVEAALNSPAPDLALARARLEELNDAPAGGPPSLRINLARLRLEDLSGDHAAAIRIAGAILESHPGDPASADAALTLGRNLFETKDYNAARLVLEKLAVGDSDPGRAQAAWLLAARSAALVGTLSSKEEALVLFDKAIDLDGPLVSIARLEKADHWIKNLYRFDEASRFLRDWFETLPKEDSLRLPAGLLLGQALYAQGGTSPNSLLEALAIYDQLLPYAKAHPSLIHRLQYLRGLVLEQLADPADPTRKRDGEAFVAYYSVLETTTPPSEWEYFELCGFKALSLLEKFKRWPAAVAAAEKIASFKGPRAEEAATRASQLQLKHRIWED